MTVRLQHQAQELAANLPPLLIEAERVAQTVLHGTHGRRRAGAGETFWQFRRYEQGDPIERIDWRQSARTDNVFLREREYEATQSAYLWADTSGSMQYRSQKNLPTKAERAQLLMLALADLALRGGEKVIWLDRRSITAHGNRGLEQIAARIGNARGESMPPAVPIARHAHVVLASDFLMEDELLVALMRGYAALNLNGVLLHILDPAENGFSLEGRLEVMGLEGEASLLLPNAATLQGAYLRELNAHKERITQLARSAGWFYTPHITNELPHLALMQIYEYLATERGSG